MDVKTALSNATIIVRNSVDGQSEKVDDPNRSTPDDLLLSFFQLRESDLSRKDETALAKISEYVNEHSKTQDPIDRLSVLKDLRYRLGDPELGVSRWQQLYQYVSLRQAAKKYETEAKAMEQS